MNFVRCMMIVAAFVAGLAVEFAAAFVEGLAVWAG